MAKCINKRIAHSNRYGIPLSPHPPIPTSPITHHPSPTPHHLPPTTHHLPPITHHLSLFLLLLLLAGCYEPRESCADINAVNFAVDADRPCPNCCLYPVLRIAVEHKVSDASNAPNLVYADSVYRDGAGNAFRVRDIRFYVSNVRLVRADGSEVHPQDSLELPIRLPDGSRERRNISKNIALVNRSTFTPYNMGTFITAGAFTHIRFTLGLSDIANQTDRAALPDSLNSHPLASEAMYINPNNGYIFNRLQIFENLLLTDTTFSTIAISGPAARREVELPLPASLIEGFNVRVTLRINYLRWFANVNLKNDPPATLATKLIDNATNSFAVTNVLLEIQ